MRASPRLGAVEFSRYGIHSFACARRKTLVTPARPVHQGAGTYGVRCRRRREPASQGLWITCEVLVGRGRESHALAALGAPLSETTTPDDSVGYDTNPPMDL